MVRSGLDRRRLRGFDQAAFIYECMAYIDDMSCDDPKKALASSTAFRPVTRPASALALRVPIFSQNNFKL